MMTRREGLGAVAMAAASYKRVLGANDKLRGALVGCGVRGIDALLRASLDMPDIDMVAACDVYKTNLDNALTKIGDKGGKADSYGDYRRVVERKDIDVVLVATPDHWHGPITVACCEAGKDVYVEKPLANTVEDCLSMIDAAAKYKRIVQMGIQQRSMQIYFDALALIRDGVIGRVGRCEMVWAYGPPRPAKPGPPDDMPEGLDWEMFQGRAPRKKYVRPRQFAWRNYWEYGTGAIADFGVHLLDVTQWFAGVDNPLSCYGMGYSSPGRLPDQVPDNISLSWRYPEFLATYATTNEPYGNIFWGETGSMHVNRGGLTVRPYDSKVEGKTLKSSDSNGAPVHMRNFLDCVRSRKRPNADAELGAHATIPCLLAGRAVREGKALRFNWNTRTVETV